MTAIARSAIELRGQRLSLLRGGPAGEPVLFIHGGVPGSTLYCSGAHIWSRLLPLTARDRHVIAPDLPGFGDSAAGDEVYRIDAMSSVALALVDALKLGPCHVVGHDEGGLIAISMALSAPSAVRSISIVASPTAAPAGDIIENLTLSNAPTPAWSRSAQTWTFERLSHNPAHVDSALLDRCVECAQGIGHRQAAARAEADEPGRALAGSIARAKGEFYAVCRERGFPVPVQIIWGSDDPLATIEHGMVLFRTIAAHQRATHFHLINRAGNFPFREQRHAFHHVVAAFHDGLAAS